MNTKLMELADSYRQAGDAIHDKILFYQTILSIAGSLEAYL